MSQVVKKYNLQFDSSTNTGTDTNFVVAGSTGRILTQNLVLQSHSAAANTVTVKVWYAGAVVFSIDYSLSANTSLFLAELMNNVLVGDSSTPDKITLAISTTLGSGETIDGLGSGVEFV